MLPRQILPGSTYLVTRRCTQRQFLLVPSRRTRKTFHYCLAYAAKRTGVIVHAVVVMSNHYHLVVTDPHGALPLFAECLNKLVAKCLNAAYGRWENFWASEPVSYVRLLDASAALEKLVYTLCNPVAAGLVARGDDWPGLRLWRPGAYPTRRPAGFFREEGSMPKSIVLDVAAAPLGDLAPGGYRDTVTAALSRCEASEVSRIRGEGRGFLGARAAARQDPFASPSTRETRRLLSPRVASRNRWLRSEVLARCADFVADYRRALSAWRVDRMVMFPVGTYLMRHRHGVPCAEA